MSEAKYIFRFDDICSNMNWTIWSGIESVLIKNNIKPIIAVVPNNQDSRLRAKDHDQISSNEFWNKINEYQQLGWTVALHGYSHVFTNSSSGILKITPRSEFSGVDKQIQEYKIKNGLAILNSYGIKSNVWVAPAHSFDIKTIEILKSNGIKYISDSFGKCVFNKFGMVWVPCQQWERIEHKKKGIYTICIHSNNWNKTNLDNFRNDVNKYIQQIISFEEAVSDKTNYGVNNIEWVLSKCRISYRNLKKTVYKGLFNK